MKKPTWRRVTHLRVTNSGSLRIFSHAPMPCFLTARFSACSSFSLQYPRTDVVAPPGPVVVLVVVVVVVLLGGSAAGRFLVDDGGFLPVPPPEDGPDAGFFLGGISGRSCRARGKGASRGRARLCRDRRRRATGDGRRATSRRNRKRTQFAN